MGERKTDADRRKRQSARLVMMVHVHKLTRDSDKLTVEKCRDIAASLNVCERTVYRYFGTLRQLYREVGTKTLD